MKRTFAAAVVAAAFFAFCGAADAATVTIPSFVVTSAPSTSISCTPTSGSLVAPVAAGTVLNTCTVTPATWTGVASLSLSPQLVVTSLSGNTFSIAVGATALAAGTYGADTITHAGTIT